MFYFPRRDYDFVSLVPSDSPVLSRGGGVKNVSIVFDSMFVRGVKCFLELNRLNDVVSFYGYDRKRKIVILTTRYGVFVVKLVDQGSTLTISRLVRHVKRTVDYVIRQLYETGDLDEKKYVKIGFLFSPRTPVSREIVERNHLVEIPGGGGVRITLVRGEHSLTEILRVIGTILYEEGIRGRDEDGRYISEDELKYPGNNCYVRYTDKRTFVKDRGLRKALIEALVYGRSVVKSGEYEGLVLVFNEKNGMIYVVDGGTRCEVHKYLQGLCGRRVRKRGDFFVNNFSDLVGVVGRDVYEWYIKVFNDDEGTLDPKVFLDGDELVVDNLISVLRDYLTIKWYILMNLYRVTGNTSLYRYMDYLSRKVFWIGSSILIIDWRKHREFNEPIHGDPEYCDDLYGKPSWMIGGNPPPTCRSKIDTLSSQLLIVILQLLLNPKHVKQKLPQSTTYPCYWTQTCGELEYILLYNTSTQ